MKTNFLLITQNYLMIFSFHIFRQKILLLKVKFSLICHWKSVIGPYKFTVEFRKLTCREISIQGEGALSLVQIFLCHFPFRAGLLAFRPPGSWQLNVFVVTIVLLFFLLCTAKGVFSPVPLYCGYFIPSHFIVFLFCIRTLLLICKFFFDTK